MTPAALSGAAQAILEASKPNLTKQVADRLCEQGHSLNRRLAYFSTSAVKNCLRLPASITM
jgi:hypothetical protein